MIQDAYLLAHGKFLPGDERVLPETGPLRFPDDHPGVFIRADKAAAYAHDLRFIVEDNTDLAVYLVDLIDLLESCQPK